MSVFVVGRFDVDPARLEEVFTQRATDVLAVSEDAKARGALHHHFAKADGQVLVVNEWDSADAFREFFNSQTTIPELLREVGLQGQPEFSFYPVLNTPGQF